mmetsp:Transcript_65498/g.109923  ORF Transcript_65498/g.109923 Transcript_65498/m.109923 type:complete len:276 (-) Transcript_65498:59-886(-)
MAPNMWCPGAGRSVEQHATLEVAEYADGTSNKWTRGLKVAGQGCAVLLFLLVAHNTLGVTQTDPALNAYAVPARTAAAQSRAMLRAYKPHDAFPRQSLALDPMQKATYFPAENRDADVNMQSSEGTPRSPAQLALMLFSIPAIAAVVGVTKLFGRTKSVPNGLLQSGGPMEGTSRRAAAGALLSVALAAPPAALAEQPDITIFGAQWCAHCAAARRDLAAYNPAFVDCESKEGEKQCAEVGVRGYPTVVRGRQKVTGWPLRETDNGPYMEFLGCK